MSEALDDLILMGILINRLGGSVNIKETEIGQIGGTVVRTDHIDGSVTLGLNPNN